MLSSYRSIVDKIILMASRSCVPSSSSSFRKERRIRESSEQRRVSKEVRQVDMPQFSEGFNKFGYFLVFRYKTS